MVLGLLGRGGMGVVYKARQIKLDRVVALKMVLAGRHASADDLERFHTEAQSIARLQHPHVVQVFEVGEHQGLPFFSLELCCGGSLEKKLGGTPLLPVEAAALVEKLARAMQAAHDQGVLHRDLKPANVLLTDDGTPKITDFGLAKRLGKAGQTATGAVMGTPSYMAPEQASSKNDELGPACDVWALGAILYECLTGRPPFKAAAPLDTILQVLSDEPVPPRQLNAHVPRDLQTICLKCLRKEPGKRYATALSLAEDLRRFQSREPIAARPASGLERSVKWMKRRPAAAALLAVSVAAVAALLSVGAWFAAKLAHERNTVTAEKERAEKEWDRAEREKTEANRQLEQSRRFLLNAHLLRAAALAQRDPETGRELLEDTEACPPALRDFAWHFYHNACARDRLALPNDSGPARAVAFSSDGRTLASVPNAPQMRLWEVPGGRRLAAFGLSGDLPTFTADGTALATASTRNGNHPAGEIVVFAVPGGKRRATVRDYSGQVTALAVTPNGMTLAAAITTKPPFEGELKVWDLPARRCRLTIRLAYTVDHLALGPDGTWLTIAVPGDGVVMLDARTGDKRRSFGPAAHVQSLAISPDGATVAVGAAVGPAAIPAARAWDIASGRELFNVPATGFGALVFSPDGRALAGGTGVSAGAGVRLLDASTGRELILLRMPGQRVKRLNCLAFSPGGQELATGFEDDTVKVWDVRQAQEPLVLGCPIGLGAALGPGLPVALGYDANELVALTGAAARSPRVQLLELTAWNVLAQRPRACSPHHSSWTQPVISPDGKAVVSLAADGTANLWDTVTGQRRYPLSGCTGQVAFSADGRSIAGVMGEAFKGITLVRERPGRELAGQTAANTGEAASPARAPTPVIQLWDVASGRETARLPSVPGRPRALALSRDAEMVAIAVENSVRCYHVASGRELTTFSARANVAQLAFSPDAQALAAANDQREVIVWDLATKQERFTLRGHWVGVASLAFSPDGRNLATSDLASVRVCDTLTGQLLATFPSPMSGPVVFRADGRALAAWRLMQIPNGLLGPLLVGALAAPAGQGPLLGAATLWPRRDVSITAGVVQVWGLSPPS